MALCKDVLLKIVSKCDWKTRLAFNIKPKKLIIDNTLISKLTKVLQFHKTYSIEYINNLRELVLINNNLIANSNYKNNLIANSNLNSNIIPNSNLNSINMLYKYEQSCEIKDNNYQKLKNEYSDNENYKLLNNNTIEDYGVIPINLNLLLHTAVQNKIDNNINSDSDSDSDNNDENESESESELKSKLILKSVSESESISKSVSESVSESEDFKSKSKSKSISKSKSKSVSKSVSKSASESELELESKSILILNSELESNNNSLDSNIINTITNKIDLPDQNLSEDNLKNKNIIDIKEIAKKFGIKLSDKGKQKNKDILIQDILIINK